MKNELAHVLLSTISDKEICFELVVRVNKVADRNIESFKKLSQEDQTTVLSEIGKAFAIIWTALGTDEKSAEGIAKDWRKLWLDTKEDHARRN